MRVSQDRQSGVRPRDVRHVRGILWGLDFCESRPKMTLATSEIPKLLNVYDTPEEFVACLTRIFRRPVELYYHPASDQVRVKDAAGNVLGRVVKCSTDP